MRRDSMRYENASEVAGMRPIFQPSLVNGPFADPALFVDVLFERRAFRAAVYWDLKAHLEHGRQPARRQIEAM